MGLWINSIIPDGSGFSLENLPWGVYKNQDTEGRICVAIGDHVLDIYEWAQSWDDKKGYGEEFGYQVKEALMEVSLSSGQEKTGIPVHAQHLQQIRYQVVTTHNFLLCSQISTSFWSWGSHTGRLYAALCRQQSVITNQGQDKANHSR